MSDVISIGMIGDFLRLFAGNKSVYGQTELLDTRRDDGKRDFRSWTEAKEPLIDVYQAHIYGKRGLGIAPLFEKEFVNFTVIDVDVYSKENQRRFVDLVYNYGLPFHPFLSKSGGLHLYTFYTIPTNAGEALDVLDEYRAFFGLEKKTEKFPKQRFEIPGGQPSWINLPYFDALNTDRPLLGPDMQPLSLYDALSTIRDAKTDLSIMRKIQKTLPFADGPPCIQTIYTQKKLGDGDGRNNYMFSLARYWKIKDAAQLDNGLTDGNERLAVPLAQDEFRKILNSVRRTNSTYLCTAEPLCSHCNKEICVKREFGIEHKDVSNLSFKQLTKYLSDPPRYVWNIDDKELEFAEERTLMSQQIFAEMCVRVLGVWPRRIKENAWRNIVQTALTDMKVVKVNPEDDFSPGTIFMEFLTEYLNYRNPTDDRSQVVMGAVYKDREKHVYVFKMTAFYQFLTRVRHFTMFNITEVTFRITRLGGASVRIAAKGGQDRAWTLPFKAVEGFLRSEALDIDFDKMAENEIGGDF